MLRLWLIHQPFSTAACFPSRFLSFDFPSLCFCLPHAPHHLILSPLHCSLFTSPFPLRIEILAITFAFPIFRQSLLFRSVCCLVFQRLSFLIGVSVHQLSSSGCFFFPSSILQNLIFPASPTFSASCRCTSGFPVCFCVTGFL